MQLHKYVFKFTTRKVSHCSNFYTEVRNYFIHVIVSIQW